MIKRRTFVTAGALTALFCGGALAQDFLGWQANYGAGANERVELILDNSACDKPAMVTVTTTEPNGLIAHESTHVVVQQNAAIVPLPALSTSSDRAQRGLNVSVEPGPCVEELATALAIIDGDGKTADIRYTSEWTDFNTHDPGLTVAKGGQNNLVHIPPTRVGAGQAAEISFWSTCRDDAIVILDITDLSTGISQTVDLLVAPSQINVLLLAPTANDPPIYFRAVGTVSGAAAVRNPCPRGFGALVGTMNMVDDDQGDTAASGLPTGKRQHKPVSVTKPSE